jgi:hypothetical protein
MIDRILVQMCTLSSLLLISLGLDWLSGLAGLHPAVAFSLGGFMFFLPYMAPEGNTQDDGGCYFCHSRRTSR